MVRTLLWLSISSIDFLPFHTSAALGLVVSKLAAADLEKKNKKIN